VATVPSRITHTDKFPAQSNRGAHLATVFTELHGFETNTSFSFGHTYTFNGPGRGEFSGGLQAETVEADRIRTMITRLTEVLTNPMAGIAPGTPEELWPSFLNAALLAQQQSPTWNPWESSSTLSVYADARYLWAKQVVEAEFSPVSRSLSDIPRTDGALRERVVDRLASWVPLPAQTTRAGVVALDKRMLELWWVELYPSWSNWN
jgi:hypothetical protein